MRIKALVSFSGALSMRIGEEREYENEFVLSDLLQAKYIEEVKLEKPKKDVSGDEVKRNPSPKRSRVSKG